MDTYYTISIQESPDGDFKVVSYFAIGGGAQRYDTAEDAKQEILRCIREKQHFGGPLPLRFRINKVQEEPIATIENEEQIQRINAILKMVSRNATKEQ